MFPVVVLRDYKPIYELLMHSTEGGTWNPKSGCMCTNAHTYGERTQFCATTYFVLRHSERTTKLNVFYCSF